MKNKYWILLLLQQLSVYLKLCIIVKVAFYDNLFDQSRRLHIWTILIDCKLIDKGNESERDVPVLAHKWRKETDNENIMTTTPILYNNQNNVFYLRLRRCTLEEIHPTTVINHTQIYLKSMFKSLLIINFC